MKVVLRIFGIIAVLIALTMGVLSVHRANEDRKDIASAYDNAQSQLAQFKQQAGEMTGETKAYLDEQIATAEKQIDQAGSPSAYLAVEVLLAGLLVLSLVFAVFLFKPNAKLILPLLGTAAILMLAAYFLAPDVERGPYGGMESKTLALVSGIPVIVAGLCAFGVSVKTAVKQTAY